MTVAPARGYDAVAKTLHWLVFALVFAQYVVALSMPGIGRNTRPGPLINLHLSIGLTILALVVLRLAWRVGHPVPLVTDAMPAWQLSAARTSHALLYLLLIVSPILGWANASAREFPITVFGLFALPSLVAPKARLGMQAGDVHTLLGWVLLVVIAIHVGAALYHRLVRHDRVLQRMLPGTGA